MTTVTVTPAGDDWENTVADTLVELLPVCAGRRFCLATGSTPAPVYRRLASRSPDLSSITLALLDEFGGLHPDDPGRCLAMLERDLLDRLRTEHRPRTEPIDPENPPEGNWPGAIRLAVLGLGMNGHIAMNEPGSAPDSPTRRVELAEATSIGALRYGARRAPRWGVTIGLGPLMASEELWVLATGGSKAAVVAAAINGPITTSVPASLLRVHPRLRWFLDEDAAHRING